MPPQAAADRHRGGETVGTESVSFAALLASLAGAARNPAEPATPPAEGAPGAAESSDLEPNPEGAAEPAPRWHTAVTAEHLVALTFAVPVAAGAAPTAVAPEDGSQPAPEAAARDAAPASAPVHAQIVRNAGAHEGPAIPASAVALAEASVGLPTRPAGTSGAHPLGETAFHARTSLELPAGDGRRSDTNPAVPGTPVPTRSGWPELRSGGVPADATGRRDAAMEAGAEAVAETVVDSLPRAAVPSVDADVVGIGPEPAVSTPIRARPPEGVWHVPSDAPVESPASERGQVEPRSLLPGRSLTPEAAGKPAADDADRPAEVVRRLDVQSVRASGNDEGAARGTPAASVVGTVSSLLSSQTPAPAPPAGSQLAEPPVRTAPMMSAGAFTSQGESTSEGSPDAAVVESVEAGEGERADPPAAPESAPHRPGTNPGSIRRSMAQYVLNGSVTPAPDDAATGGGLEAPASVPLRDAVLPAGERPLTGRTSTEAQSRVEMPASVFLTLAREAAVIPTSAPSSGAPTYLQTPDAPLQLGPFTGGPADQIVRAVRLQWRDGVGEARLTLQPEHLGQVVISLRVEQGAVSAVLRAENAAAADWIRLHQTDLKASLAQQGLGLDSLEVTVDPDDRRRQPAHERQADFVPRPRRRSAPQALFDVRV
jgi:flagellar hook-length control protein FliK